MNQVSLGEVAEGPGYLRVGMAEYAKYSGILSSLAPFPGGHRRTRSHPLDKPPHYRLRIRVSTELPLPFRPTLLEQPQGGEGADAVLQSRGEAGADQQLMYPERNILVLRGVQRGQLDDSVYLEA